MKDIIFKRILIAIVCAGVVLTVAHLIYAAYAYQYSSIIYFISKEIW